MEKPSSFWIVSVAYLCLSICLSVVVVCYGCCG